jgi:hypothetical protein
MVQPGDYLAAAQAGANVGLNIAKMRQALDFQNAENDQKREERMSAAARLAAQLSSQRDLKLMDIGQQQLEAGQALAKSTAALDLTKANLTLDQAKQNFAEEQSRLKMRSAADVALETGKMLKELASAKTPEDRAKIAAAHPGVPSADNVALQSFSQMASEQTRKDAASKPVVESFTTRMVPEGEGMLKPGLTRFGSKGSVQWLSDPAVKKPDEAAAQRSEETIHKQHTALVRAYNAAKKDSADKPFLAKEIARLEAQYPFLVPMIAPVEDPAVAAASGAVIPMQSQPGLTLPQTNSFTSGKYSVRIK